MMPTIHQWLNEYGESHKNQTNKTIHWVCVPLIFFAIVGLLYSIKLPILINAYPLNMAIIILLFAVGYYFWLSKTLWVGMLLFSLLCVIACHFIETVFSMQLWIFSLLVFVVAWAGQFYGHKIEGKKPSFIKDIQFSMIGPAWLMSFIYQRLGIKL